VIDFEYLTKEELEKNGKWEEEYEIYEKYTNKTEEELNSLEGKIVSREKQKGTWEAENETIKISILHLAGSTSQITGPSSSFETLSYDIDNLDGSITALPFGINNGAEKSLLSDDAILSSYITDVEIEELREGKFKIKLPKKRAFRAGKYRITIELIRDGVSYIVEQDFTWGVLVINTHKATYLENEQAFISVGVLDDFGRMVCDADVTLKILVGPSLATSKSIYCTTLK